VTDRGRLVRADADAILPVTIGTAVWALVLVALLLGRSTLDANGTTWWLGAAAVGLVSGIGGIAFLRWRRVRTAGRSAAATPAGPADQE
jgi:ABC-type nickel/cobalt efflux system permease component RcnA